MSELKILKKERDVTIDILRGLGIFLVVLGHSGFQLSRFIYLFHVPLFFFISGMLFKSDSADDLLKFFKKKFRNLIIPFIGWELFYLLIRNLLVFLSIYSSSQGIYTFNDVVSAITKILSLGIYDPLSGPIWFVQSLFWTSVVVGLLFFVTRDIESKRSVRLVSVFILFILSYVTYRLGYVIPRGISIGVLSSIFFIAGAEFNKVKDSLNTNIYHLFIILPILLVAGIEGKIHVVLGKFTNMPFFIVVPLIGIYATYIISKYLKGWKISKSIIYLGNVSFGVMVLHQLGFKIFDFVLKYLVSETTDVSGFRRSFNGGWYWLGYTIFGILVSVVIIEFSKQIRNILAKIRKK